MFQIAHRELSKHRHDLVPQRLAFPFASTFDGDGCAALTGSEAGKLSIRPASNFVWVSRSAKALRGVGGMLVMWRRIEFL